METEHESIENYEDRASTILVKFYTKLQEPFALPEEQCELSVPDSCTRKDLSLLINDLLALPEPRAFDFSLADNFLRSTLDKHIAQYGMSTESTIDIEYLFLTVPEESKDKAPHEDWVSGIKRVSSNKMLTSCYDGSLRIFDDATFEILHTEKISDEAVKCIDFNGKDIIAYSMDFKLRSYEFDGEKISKCKHEYVGFEDTVQAVTFSTCDNTLFIAAAADGCYLYEIGRSEPIRKFTVGENAFMAVSFTAPECFYAGSLDHSLRKFDIESGLCTQTWNSHSPILAIAATDDGMLLTAHADRVRLWDPSLGKGLKATYRSGPAILTDISVSPTKTALMFATSAVDGSITIWDSRSTNEPLYVRRNLTQYQQRSLCVDFCRPDKCYYGSSKWCGAIDIVANVKEE